MDFKDKVVIITGSSSGIGAITALHFARLSAKVVITGRNEEKLNNVAKAVEDAKGIKPLVIKADITDDDSVKGIVDETIQHFGKIDVLINNAGTAIWAGTLDGIESFDKVIPTNLRSAYLLTSLAAPHLIKTKGNIINISSIMAVKAFPKALAYCISKAGLDMFSKCVAKELAPHGVRVNAVNPGHVNTDIRNRMDVDKEEIHEHMKKQIEKAPLGFISSSEDVAELIAFLASDKAKSITGSNYFVDSGEMLVS